MTPAEENAMLREILVKVLKGTIKPIYGWSAAKKNGIIPLAKQVTRSAKRGELKRAQKNRVHF